MRIAGLPFPVQIVGEVRATGPALLRVHLDLPFDDVGFDQLRCVVAWFAELGSAGAWCGDSLPSSQSQVRLASPEPDQRGALPSWQFDQLAIDPRACVVLANLIYATQLPVRAVELLAQGTTYPGVLQCDEYPPLARGISFAIDENRTDRNVQISIDFAGDLDPALHDIVTDQLRTWTMVSSLGGFRTAPATDDADGLPETEPEVTLDQLTLSVQDRGLHSGAWDCLANLCAGMQARGVPIVRLTID